MNKTIHSLTQTTNHHPALGPLFKVTFTDNSQDLVYAETFFHQIDEWYPFTQQYGLNWLAGKVLNTSDSYYNFSL
jgi:hypothetical protein